MRRAIVVMAVVTAPVALFATSAADAAAGAPAAAPAAVQADVTKKARPAVAPQKSRRGTGLRADDAGTPPSPETAPAMSASSHLDRTTGGAHAVAPALPGARAPPA
jgi:hypothetical protein